MLLLENLFEDVPCPRKRSGTTKAKPYEMLCKKCKIHCINLNYSDLLKKISLPALTTF